MNTYTFTNVHELDEFLRRYGVPVWSYGLNQAKTLAQLLEEVKKGECRLSVEDGRVVRSAGVVCLNVYQNGLILVEDKQIFLDGRERRRKSSISLGEKIEKDETQEKALDRLIQQEEVSYLESVRDQIIQSSLKLGRVGESPGYPGIISKYEFFLYEVSLPETLTVPLVIHEPDGKIVHYRWETRTQT